jgi:hypothetical protein
LARIAPALAALLGGGSGLLLLLLALLPNPAAAQEVKQGTVIVQFDAAAQSVRPFTFTGEIAGLDALMLSGLDVVTTTTSFGPAVCSIEGVGCPAEDCFCDAAKYWAYSGWDGTAWQSYAVGAGSSVISTTGAVEGWYWSAFGDVQTPAPVALAAGTALEWLAGQQAADGGYGGAGGTVETLLAAAGNGAGANQVGAWRAGPAGLSLADAALRDLAAYTRSGAAAAGKGTAALAAAGLCLPPTAARPHAFYDEAPGTFSPQSGPNAWGMLGVLGAGEALPAGAAAGLMVQALPSGGWEWAPGWGADTNATALAVQALLAAGEPVTATAVQRGLAYMKSAQNSDGGFAYALTAGTPGPSDTNSTAYVVQALIAAGEEVDGAVWSVGGRSPIDYLLSMRNADGSFAWQAGGGANLLATQQAIPALLGRPLPYRNQVGRSAGQAPGALAACPAVFLAGIER